MNTRTISDTQKKAIGLARKLKPTAAWRNRQILETSLEPAKEWLTYALKSHDEGKPQACIADLLDAKPYLENLIALLNRLEKEEPNV